MSSLTNRKPALGRGLSALLSDARSSFGHRSDTVTYLPLREIYPGLNNPRHNFSTQELEELSVSLKNQGVLQPILVRRGAQGGAYHIIAGERRFRAAQRAGLEDIPAVIKETTDAEAYELALVENIQREDLSPLEEAHAYQRLIEEYKLTQEAVAARVGKERSTVANALRLLLLPQEVKQLLAEGALDMGHARTLLGLPRMADMLQLARKVIAKKLSVRETEAAVRAQRHPQKTKPKAPSPAALALVEDMQRLLGTRVRLVEKAAGKGTLEIDFFSYEDLERITQRIRR